MTNLRIGIETLSLRQPLKKALHTASALGADGVEIDLRRELPAGDLSQTAVRQVRKLLDDLGLRLASASFPTRRGYEVHQDLERRILATQQAMKLTYDLGARVLVNRVGVVPADAADGRFDRLIQSLALLGASGERLGVRLAAQGPEGGPEFARVLQALSAESIGIDFDPAKLIMDGYAPLETIAEIGSAVIHVHATDAVRDLSLGRAVEVELGRGTADVPAILGRLEELNYLGWLVIKRRDTKDPVTEIGNAVAFLRSF